MHMIPTDPELWKMERFEDFVAERKKLITAACKFLDGSTENRWNQAVLHKNQLRNLPAGVISGNSLRTCSRHPLGRR